MGSAMFHVAMTPIYLAGFVACIIYEGLALGWYMGKQIWRLL